MKPNPSSAASSLVGCAQLRVDGEASQRIFAFARSAPDWETLLAAAAEHSMVPIFCRNVEAHAGAALDSAWRQRFGQESLGISCRNLALTAELFRVLEALENCHVCATPYKGPVLAAQAYGDAAMRQFSDLDIIVPQGEIGAAHKALLGLGFQPLVPELKNPRDFRRIPGQYAYRNDAETLVELHTEFTLRYFPRRLDLAELSGRREFVSLAGRNVLTFSPEDTLLLLSVHGSKHLWERLGWIADIAALADGPRSIDWAAVLERAGAWGNRRMVLLGAGLAARLFSARLPKGVMDCLERDGIARRLIDGICQRVFGAEPIRLGVFSRFAFRVQMRGSVARGLTYGLRLAITPTELDRGGHASFLEPLHVLARPLRLGRTYGWRTRAGS